MPTLGGIFAFLGWHYHRTSSPLWVVTLLICLSLLATESPMHLRRTSDRGTAARRA